MTERQTMKRYEQPLTRLRLRQDLVNVTVRLFVCFHIKRRHSLRNRNLIRFAYKNWILNFALHFNKTRITKIEFLTLFLHYLRNGIYNAEMLY